MPHKKRGPYWTPAWRYVRKAVLERDGYRCQIKGPTCTGTATHVDHIIPWLQGGEPYDPANLRAACQTCNTSRAHHPTTPPPPHTGPSRHW